MKKALSILSEFPKHLFWDMDCRALDIQRDCDIIIPRALIASTRDTFLDDIVKLESLYTREPIVTQLKMTKERVSNTICTLVAERYHIANFARFHK